MTVGLPSVVAYIQGLLNGIALPFASAELAAFITPPDPYVETVIAPVLYVLTGDGPEKRLTDPRNTGPGTPAGWKTLDHDIKLHIIWEIASSSPVAPGAADPDVLFSGVIETVMAALRSSTAPQVITDPNTGQQTTLLDTGERMTFHYLPRHSTKNQRMVRYDALIDLPLQEIIQA